MIRPKRQIKLAFSETRKAVRGMRGLEVRGAIPAHTEASFIKFLKTERGQELAKLYLLSKERKATRRG